MKWNRKITVNGVVVFEESGDGDYIIKNDYVKNTSEKYLWGPRKWKALHTRAMQATDLTKEAEWIKSFETDLPGCDCRKHWREILKALQPDLSSKESYFEWTVKAHNEVNKLLNKSLFSLEEAKRLYR